MKAIRQELASEPSSPAELPGSMPYGFPMSPMRAMKRSSMYKDENSPVHEEGKISLQEDGILPESIESVREPKETRSKLD